MRPSGDISQLFFSVRGFAVPVNGEQVQVFEYPSDAGADAAAATVSPDGGTVGRTSVMWVAPPHFYRQGRIIALYVGSSTDMLNLLTSVLRSQFAGR